MKVTLPFSPRPAQRVIFKLLSLYRFVTAVCHRRLGKTRGAVAWLVEEGLKHDDPTLPFRGYYFAKTKDQARIVCWEFFKQMLQPLKAQGKVEFHETFLCISLPNDGKIYLKSGEPDSVESARGIYMHRCVLDELASWMKPQIAWNEVLRPALADTQGRALFIGTVKGLDLLYEFFKRGADKRFSQWGSVMFKASETGILPDAEIEDIKLENEGDPSTVARELECDFFAETSDVMIPAKLVQPAVENSITDLNVSLSRYAVFIGIDPGVTADPTMVCVRQGPYVHEFIEFNDPDHELLADKLIPIIEEWRAARVYIDSGRGEQLITQLRKKLAGGGVRVVSVTFNAPSPSASCYNLRTYLYWALKNWFRDAGKCIPDDTMLVQELCNQLLDDTDDSGSVLRLVKKRKIRQLLRRSPNKADSLAVTFAGGPDCTELADNYVADLMQAQFANLARRSGVSSIPELGGEGYDPVEHLKHKMGGRL